MIIVLIGPPFSGKDTQSQLLEKKLGIPVFSIGKIIREAYKTGDPKAVKGFEEYSLKGLHLPNYLKFDFLKEKLDKQKNGFILNNYPATGEDLLVILDYLKKRNLNIDVVFNLNISKEEMIKRMKFRGRPDDNINTVMKRREIQDEDRAVVIEYFKKEDILKEINSENSVDMVHRKIIEYVKT